MIADGSNLLAVNDSLVILTHTQYSTVIIPCRPTSPNVTVILQKDGNVVSIGDFFQLNIHGMGLIY